MLLGNVESYENSNLPISCLKEVWLYLHWVFYISDDMYGHYVSSAGYSYHPPVAPILSVADMIPPPPPPPGEGPLEGMVSYHHGYAEL